MPKPKRGARKDLLVDNLQQFIAYARKRRSSSHRGPTQSRPKLRVSSNNFSNLFSHNDNTPANISN